MPVARRKSRGQGASFLLHSRGAFAHIRKLGSLCFFATAGMASLVACYADNPPPGREPGGPASSGQAGHSGAKTTSTGGSGGSSPAEGGQLNGDSGAAGALEEPGIVGCQDSVADRLPARIAITSLEDAPDTRARERVITLTKASLFRDFEQLGCGPAGCHGGADQPLARSPEVFKMTLNSFDQRSDLGRGALERILSSDPLKVMPPGSGDGSQRGEQDPLRRLGERLLAWEDAGFPESFQITIQAEPEEPELPTEPYLLSPTLASKLTSLGSCIPSRAMLEDDDLDLRDEMDRKDALFAGLSSSEELPDTLFETDLVSLDSAALARRGVFSYAPTYTLFSDHAGKMRHVRVPVGEIIRYNPDTRDFDIPDNTRFYKTFLKDVRDKDGNVGHRKMETRIIVVRNDERLPDGSFKTRALRASYAWDKDERMARRVKDPFRDGKPAADRLCAYVVDETMTRDPQQNPISDELSETCTYMTEDELEDPSSGKIRHYAIPSTERCDQCHMGSSSHSYILGFNPWQVDRRPDGEGGVYEAPSADDLTQLKRLIEYGVISGIEPGQAKLEESQGERKPRNDYELKAQGYMLGNCAFCHLPHGFPVVQNPILKPFDLFPSDAGGIFEFSLERYSPRAKAGQAQTVRFPYITSAFGDHDLGARVTQVRKVVENAYPAPVVDADSAPSDYSAITTSFTFLGPWRSLIWRNVYTPFTYEEDSTIFVHMPRNVAGFDCRAQKIMAEWMLSIPSVGKDRLGLQFTDEQPMHEVRPEDTFFNLGVQEAPRRLRAFRSGITATHCPPDDDIVDPMVILSPRDLATNRKLQVSPIDRETWNNARLVPDLPYPLLDWVPDHAHWISTDVTEPPGKWVPRRPNWEALIASREVPVEDELGRVIDDLQSIHLSPRLRDFSLEPLPMGLWHLDCQTHPEVLEFPTGGELLEDRSQPLRRWIGDAQRSQRVHLQSRGEAVFRSICQNCHGREADSKSPLASTILELTGGQTRVANFLDGLFGPPGAPGAFARDEFLVNRGVTPEEWQARYTIFMGLGGTEANIPRAILDLVATSPFYGGAVTAPGGGDPNMLDSAVQLCLKVLSGQRSLPENPRGSPLAVSVTDPTFGKGVGHYELWESLCTLDNDPIVQVFDVSHDPFTTNFGAGAYRAKDESSNWTYPTNHPVGTVRGEVELGIQPSNPLPWCLRVQDETERQKALTWAARWSIPEDRVPICPASLLARALGQPVHRLAINSLGIDSTVPFGNQDFIERWARRGAMNAGLAAYYFLRGMTNGDVKPSQPFDFCLN